MVTAPSSGPAQQVREVVEPVVTAAGLHLEDVVLAKAGRRTVVRVVVDLGDDAVGSLDLDSLGTVSRDVSQAMDAADPVRGEYTLEVSTPGTDRPLTQLRHFRRARTRLVRLAMRDGSVVRGRLVDADADGYEVQVDDGDAASVVRVAPGDVARGEVEVELTRADADDEEGSA